MGRGRRKGKRKKKKKKKKEKKGREPHGPFLFLCTIPSGKGKKGGGKRKGKEGETKISLSLMQGYPRVYFGQHQTKGKKKKKGKKREKEKVGLCHVKPMVGGMKNPHFCEGGWGKKKGGKGRKKKERKGVLCSSAKTHKIVRRPQYQQFNPIPQSNNALN